MGCCGSSKGYTQIEPTQKKKLDAGNAGYGTAPAVQQNKPTTEAEKLFRAGMQCIQNNDLEGAFQNFMQSHKIGHPKASTELFKVVYQIGMNYKENYDFKNAFEMFEEAASGMSGPEVDGLPEAQVELGLCYLGGRGVAKDKEKARIWYTHAANRGHHLAPQLLKIVDMDPSQGQSATINVSDAGVTIT